MEVTFARPQASIQASIHWRLPVASAVCPNGETTAKEDVAESCTQYSGFQTAIDDEVSYSIIKLIDQFELTHSLSKQQSVRLHPARLKSRVDVCHSSSNSSSVFSKTEK